MIRWRHFHVLLPELSWQAATGVSAEKEGALQRQALIYVCVRRPEQSMSQSGDLSRPRTLDTIVMG